MGLVVMSERELNRIEVLSQVEDGRLDVAAAANLLCVTRRQVFRLLRRFREDGPSAIRHKARGKPPNKRYRDSLKVYALDLVRENYAILVRRWRLSNSKPVIL